ncbi:MAG: hypothetical protein ACI3Z8_08710 [Paludibacteraceae bacterium]
MWLSIALLLAGCNHRGPQRPSQRSGSVTKEDSTALALVEMNQRMAIAADEEVLRYVQQKEDAARFAQMPISNAWVSIRQRGEANGKTPAKDETWHLMIKTYSLSGKLLIDTEQDYRIGRNELPLCIEMQIGEWTQGTEAVVVAPWYTAFGMMGTEDIPGYENVEMVVRIDDKVQTNDSYKEDN